MIKRLFDSETYQKIGCPDLTHKIYFNRDGKKIWGKVVSLKHTGFSGKIQIGIQPLK